MVETKHLVIGEDELRKHFLANIDSEWANIIGYAHKIAGGGESVDTVELISIRWTGLSLTIEPFMLSGLIKSYLAKHMPEAEYQSHRVNQRLQTGYPNQANKVDVEVQVRIVAPEEKCNDGPGSTDCP